MFGKVSASRDELKCSFPALAIITTSSNNPGSINGQATRTNFEPACSPAHEALHFKWENLNYCEMSSSKSNSSDQNPDNEEMCCEKVVSLRRHPSYLQRDTFQHIRSPTDLSRKNTSSLMIKACFVPPPLCDEESSNDDDTGSEVFQTI